MTSAVPRGPAPTKHLDILAAAARLFAQKGVAQTPTRQIAAAAETTERTLFKHFGSKERLVHALIEEAVLPHLAPTSLQALRTAVEAFKDDFVAWHVALLEARAQALAEAPDLTRLLLVEMLRDEALLARFTDEWVPSVWKPLVELFSRLQADGRLTRDVPAEALVRMFLSLNLGYLIARYVFAPARAWDDSSERQAVADLFARGAGCTRSPFPVAPLKTTAVAK